MSEIATDYQGALLVLCEQYKERPKVNEKGRFVLLIGGNEYIAQCAVTEDEKRRAIQVAPSLGKHDDIGEPSADNGIAHLRDFLRCKDSDDCQIPVLDDARNREAVRTEGEP